MTIASTAATMPTRRSTRTTTTRRPSSPGRPTTPFFGEGLVVGKVAVRMIAVMTAVALLLPEFCGTGTVAAFAVAKGGSGAGSAAAAFLGSRAPFGRLVRTAAAQYPGMLHAKQRRRKQRRDDSLDEDELEGESRADSSSPEPVDDDLPDFVLAEEMADEPSPASTSSSLGAVAESPTTRRTGASAAASPKSIDDAFKEAKSVRELLGDRSLEKKMVFGDASAVTTRSEASDEPLPDLVEMARKASSNKSTKRQEQASRKAALQAAAASSDPDNSKLSDVVSKLPFITNDKGEITPQKVLEAGTWLGIFLLVGWELYINSPLFDRAGPMAPVVY